MTTDQRRQFGVEGVRTAGVGQFYMARSDATPEAGLNALVAVYAYLLNKKAAERAFTSDGGKDGSIRIDKEVSHVAKRSDANR